MTDASNDQPMEAFDRGNPARRCTGHRRNGDQCRKWAMRGGSVCGTHGGRAPQVKAKARQRLEEASDRMAKALLGMATDDNVTDAVKLAAIRDALSRAGITEKTAVEVEVALKPWEQILEGVAEQVESGSRAEFRRSQGIADDSDSTPPALADRPTPDADGIVDAEIVSPTDEFVSRIVGRHVNDSDEPMTHGDAERRRDEHTAPGTGQAGGSTGGLMSLEEANEEAARLRRNAARTPMPPPAGLRALPPGRS